MKSPLELPNPSRMWGSRARVYAIDNHCSTCNRCLIVEGAWVLCDQDRCDDAIPREDITYWETARETVKRIGREPLGICQYVGSC
jgi:hypothetical protein